MPLKGGLREFSLPDLFQLIHFGKKNGTLVITNGDSKGYVCFRNGNIFFATHNWKRPPLGERLVQAGMVTDEQLREALDLQKASRKDQRLGNILCELDYLSRESLEVFVEEQIRDAVFNLLRWTEGEFDFDPDEIFPEEDIGLSMSTEDLILEGSRRMDEWYQLEKKVPSLDSVFKMVKEPGKDASDMNLTSDEWLVLYHIDGESSVRDIIEKSGQSALVTCRALFGLVTAGLVSLAGEVHITPAVEDVDFADEVVQVKESETSGSRASAAEKLADRVEDGKKQADKGYRRGRKRPSRAKKKVTELEEEPEAVSLGDESEEDVTVEEIAIEGEAEDSRKRNRKPRRKATKPEETKEKEKVAEVKVVEPEVEAKPDKKRKPAVAGPPKAGTPAPGQSLVDYYKSLALQEATDNDTLTAYEETEEKRTDVESATDSVEIEASVAEDLEEEAVEIDVGEEDTSEFSEPQEIPVEWESHLAEHRIKRDKKADESSEDHHAVSGEGGHTAAISKKTDKEKPRGELEEQVVLEDAKPRNPRKRRRPARAEVASDRESEDVLLGETESEPEIIEEEELSAAQDIEVEAPEGEVATVEVEEIENESVEAQERKEEEEVVIEGIAEGDDSSDVAAVVQAEPSAEDTAAIIEPPDAELVVPLMEETSSIDEAALPSEEEIEKLLQVTPPSRELSREELLAFDQPTYRKLETRDASAMSDVVAPTEEETTVLPTTSDIPDSVASETPEEMEAATAKAQDGDNAGNGELGRIIQFGKPGLERGEDVILEQPDPIVKSASIEKISTAEDLQVAFDATRGQAAPEIDTREEETVPSVIEEVVSVEDIPLVLDEALPTGARPQTTDEPKTSDVIAGTLDVIGLDEPGANVIPIDTAKSISIAEELDVGGSPAPAQAPEAQRAESYQPELNADVTAYEAPEAPPPAETYEAPVEPEQAEAYQAELNADTKAEEPAMNYETELIAVAEANEAQPAELAEDPFRQEPAADYSEDAYSALAEQTYATDDRQTQQLDEGIDEVSPWDTASAEQTKVQPEPQEVSEFSDQAAIMFADHASEGYVEPPPVPSDEPLPEPVSPEGYDHIETLQELSTDEVETQEDEGEIEEEPQVVMEPPPEVVMEPPPEAVMEPPPEAQEPEMVADDLDEEGIMGPLTVSGKRDAGTSLIDLETFELEQELLELAGEGPKKKERLPISEKPAKKKEKKGRGKSKGKEVDKGSVKKIIDDMKKM